MDTRSIIPVERIERIILLIRGQKAILDADLAELYGVQTKSLNQAVKPHRDRFPSDFLLQLTREEAELLRSQSVTSIRHGGRRYLPHAVTEQGVAMLSSVLNSPQAIRVNIEIMRAFVRLRRILASHVELTRKLQEMERKFDHQFKIVFETIRQLLAHPEPKAHRRRIGFVTSGE